MEYFYYYSKRDSIEDLGEKKKGGKNPKTEVSFGAIIYALWVSKSKTHLSLRRSMQPLRVE